MEPFLAATSIIDWHNPAVLDLARQLAVPQDPNKTAQNCFEWVRDHIRHSVDFQLNPVTCSASEVLAAGTGYCYAKSHLLAALLRANGIPAGFCYQRIPLDQGQHCLHGLNAIRLNTADWYRVDARGNKPGVDAQFTPPHERLAFPEDPLLPEIHAEPLPEVIDALRRHGTWDALLADLPDLQNGNSADAVVRSKKISPS